MPPLLVTFDRKMIIWLKNHHHTVARVVLFIIFAWFGFLKVIGESPANGLVVELLNKTLPFIAPDTFFVLLGLFEILIGLLFLTPKAERAAIALLIPHMLMTASVLVILVGVAWKGFLVPTMEGQYIIKNLALLALAFTIGAQLHPLELDKKRKK